MPDQSTAPHARLPPGPRRDRVVQQQQPGLLIHHPLHFLFPAANARRPPREARPEHIHDDGGSPQPVLRITSRMTAQRLALPSLLLAARTGLQPRQHAGQRTPAAWPPVPAPAPRAPVMRCATPPRPPRGLAPGLRGRWRLVFARVCSRQPRRIPRVPSGISPPSRAPGTRQPPPQRARVRACIARRDLARLAPDTPRAIGWPRVWGRRRESRRHRRARLFGTTVHAEAMRGGPAAFAAAFASLRVRPVRPLAAPTSYAAAHAVAAGPLVGRPYLPRERDPASQSPDVIPMSFAPSLACSAAANPYAAVRTQRDSRRATTPGSRNARRIAVCNCDRDIVAPIAICDAPSPSFAHLLCDPHESHARYDISCWAIQGSYTSTQDVTSSQARYAAKSGTLGLRALVQPQIPIRLVLPFVYRSCITHSGEYDSSNQPTPHPAMSTAG
ncbi:hypothetical protein CERSUDRAFT_92672 [Gelatoporia subvermispora B]|uniref:Uncharacterized protein n=1 Tax=Ceriporiopsis subvermispora (strain B) TaxID=914234 RepID=M2PTW8_CERS8|nr:hypothetical protein CERSUDRAFT_92672 [Gelatoporia subvermispora B]